MIRHKRQGIWNIDPVSYDLLNVGLQDFTFFVFSSREPTSYLGFDPSRPGRTNGMNASTLPLPTVT